VPRCASGIAVRAVEDMPSAAEPARFYFEPGSAHVIAGNPRCEMSVDDEIRAAVTYPEIQKRLAKYLALRCFRNSVLEDRR
jgi:hypothetical protein